MRYGVRIRHLEPSLLEVVAVVQQRPTYEQRTLGIDNDANAIGFHQDVPVSGAVDKIHLILQTRTTSTNDRDSERAKRAALPQQQL